MNRVQELLARRKAYERNIQGIDSELLTISPDLVSACTICGAPLSDERRASHPSAVTCSKECSDDHKRRLRRMNARLFKERKLAQELQQ